MALSDTPEGQLNSNDWRWVLATGGVMCLLAIVLGAFAAHGLKKILDAYSLGIFETAVRYQMYQGLALLLLGVLSRWPAINLNWLKKSAIFSLLGSIVFSGSLYFLALTGVKWLGAVTPVGGILIILGWICFLLALYKALDRKK